MRCGFRLVFGVLALLTSLPADQGARYLIITPDQFVQAAQPLADWKTAKGMLAKIVPTSVTGTDSVSVRNYILNAYNTWPIRPENIMLLGAPEFIQSASNRDDCWFGDMTGDYKMEIPVGRFPALNVHECSTFVAKVLAYENPAQDGDTTWYIKGTTVVREDVPTDSTYQPDSRYARQCWTANGYVLAESLADFWGHTSANVNVAAQDGRAFITYRGGGTGYWYPPFHLITPSGWANGAKLPIVIGATCHTVTLAPGETMYGDQFVRAGSPDALGGAIAYFGPTMAVNSGSKYRSACYRGFFHALYEEGVWRLGTATLRGRFRVDSLYSYAARYIEWNLLGDPEMNVWTGKPKRLTVEHDSTMLMAPRQFGVTVRSNGAPVSGAVVCVSLDSVVYAWDITDLSGQVALAVNPTHPGVMKVVVTGRNLRPYTSECEVIYKDITCNTITAPASIVDSGSLVIPACQVYNYGSRPETYQVKMRIGSEYEDCVTVAVHQPQTYRLVAFHDWVPQARGRFSVSCSTRLALDQGPSNDRIAGSVLVRVRDVGVTAISSPVGTYAVGSVITPKAAWRNCGNAAVTFKACMQLDNPGTGRSYFRSVDVVGLEPDSDASPDGFLPCTLDARGKWTVRCSTYLPYDARRDNDVMAGVFGTAPEWPAGWNAAQPVPLTPSALPVKDGGWLAIDGAYGLVYAGKGNKTSDFYCYDAAGDSWQERVPIPDGTEGKKPGKGAVGVADGAGRLFFVKGNNTSGFWLHDAAKDSWYQKRNVPLGPTDKKVKGGTDLVCASDGLVYLLKGYKSEFWRYDPAGDSWHQLADAPHGASPKWDKGSWLAYDGNKTIYAHKAKHHEFYAYNTETGLWYDTLPAMPIPGSAGTKKSKDGGCGVYAGGSVYALKGGNTQEFWKYSVSGSSWAELETIPAVGPAGTKKKKVKAGADIASYGSDVLFALKGNKTNELWRYVTSAGFGLTPNASRSTQDFGVMPDASYVMHISPNPLASGYARLVVGGTSLSRLAVVRLYDATGRCVGVWKPLLRNGGADLDLRRLAAGVYLARVEADGFTTTQKLVVQRQ